jgi:hypothetical protein
MVKRPKTAEYINTEGSTVRWQGFVPNKITTRLKWKGPLHDVSNFWNFSIVCLIRETCHIIAVLSDDPGYYAKDGREHVL